MDDLDPRTILNEIKARADAATTYKCEHCGYPDENADGKLWRCTLCGCEDAEAVKGNLDPDKDAMAAALTAVLELHKPERRYMPYEGADVSYSTEREAIEASADVDLGAVAIVSLLENGAPYFDLCAHCKAIEDSPCDGDCTQEAGYRESLYPCPTVSKIQEVLDASA